MASRPQPDAIARDSASWRGSNQITALDIDSPANGTNTHKRHLQSSENEDQVLLILTL